MKGKVIIFLLISLPVSIIGSLAQEIKIIHVKEIYKIERSGDLSRCEIRIAIPQDYERRQKVKSIEYSKRPSYLMKQGDSRYAMYELSGPEFSNLSSIEIDFEIELFDYDFTVATEIGTGSKLNKSERKKLTKNIGLYHLSLDNVDTILFETSDNLIETTHKIHDYVVNHLEYQTFFGRDQGAEYALSNGKGDCTEYADLMIALCRLNNIPARRVSGYTANLNASGLLSQIFRSTGHSWTEVYFDDYGWVPFDPTHSDGDPSTNFNNLRTKYIYETFSDPDKTLEWRWWGFGQLKIKLDRKIEFLN